VNSFCRECNGIIVERVSLETGVCCVCRRDLGAEMSGPWQWRSCSVTDDARSSSVYRATARGRMGVDFDVDAPGPVAASTCSDPPREVKGGEGLLAHLHRCSLTDAFPRGGR
jgi:hypothetical protein